MAEAMAISLYPDFTEKKKTLKDRKPDALLFQEGYLTRTWYNTWPMQQFMRAYNKKGVKMELTDLEEPELLKDGEAKNFCIPYYIPCYEFILAKMLTCPDDPDVVNGDWIKSTYHRLNNSDTDIFRRAIQVCNLKDEYQLFKIDADAINWNNQVKHHEYSNDKRGSITVALIELEGIERPLERALKYRNRPKDTERMKRVLDGVEKIEDADIFIMPELSLPVRCLFEFCRRSAKSDVAFVAGIEYLIQKGKVFNYIITTIPVTIGGIPDAIPVIRLKNHYAPSEKINIEKFRLNEPDHKNMKYGLFHWRNHTFASYCCYELANIEARGLFASKIDALYATVWNKDTHYYNDIVGSTTRDLSCFFILSNVSQYGWSQIASPTKHDSSQSVIIKVGNTNHNDVVVLSGKLPIAELRYHQQLSERGQLDNKEHFKVTPPQYIKDEVTRRVDNQNLIDSDIQE